MTLLAGNNRLVASNPIVRDNGTMQEPFLLLALNVTNKLVVTGTGSPEAVLEAPQFSEYIDENGTTGSIKYVKMLTEIGGDRSKGWTLE